MMNPATATNIGQAAWVARQVLQKDIPLTLFVLIFGEG
jgi:hypothetical protein